MVSTRTGRSYEVTTDRAPKPVTRGRKNKSVLDVTDDVETKRDSIGTPYKPIVIDEDSVLQLDAPAVQAGSPDFQYPRAASTASPGAQPRDSPARTPLTPRTVQSPAMDDGAQDAPASVTKSTGKAPSPFLSPGQRSATASAAKTSQPPSTPNSPDQDSVPACAPTTATPAGPHASPTRDATTSPPVTVTAACKSTRSSDVAPFFAALSPFPMGLLPASPARTPSLVQQVHDVHSIALPASPPEWHATPACHVSPARHTASPPQATASPPRGASPQLGTVIAPEVPEPAPQSPPPPPLCPKPRPAQSNGKSRLAVAAVLLAVLPLCLAGLAQLLVCSDPPAVTLPSAVTPWVGPACTTLSLTRTTLTDQLTPVLDNLHRLLAQPHHPSSRHKGEEEKEAPLDIATILHKLTHETFPGQVRKLFEQVTRLLESLGVAGTTAQGQGQQEPSAAATASASSSSLFQSLLSLEAFMAMLPSSGGWSDRAADLWHTAATQSSGQHKAAAALLVHSRVPVRTAAGDDVPDGSTVAWRSTLRASVPAGCLLELDGITPDHGKVMEDGNAGDGLGWGSGSAGELQSAVASFLSRCPGGVVMVDRLVSMSPAQLSVLNNALSEAGGLTLDGRTVPTAGALFIFPVLTASATNLMVTHLAQGAEGVAEGADAGGGTPWVDHGAFERAVKDEVVSALRASSSSSSSGDFGGVAERGVEGDKVAGDGASGVMVVGAAESTAVVAAFRRRLDAVFLAR